MASDPLTLFYNHDLSKFLKEHKTDSRDPSLTTTAIHLKKDFEIGSKWNIDDDYPKFIELLYDYLFVQNGKPLSIAEHPKLNSPKPLVIDLDFHYPNHNSLIRTFNKSHIMNFTKHIALTIKHFLNIDKFEKLRFFITLRNGPYKELSKPYNKDGIHILCPDISLSYDKQKVIRNYILENNLLKLSFEGTGYNNLDDKVYDETLTRKQAWYPYGESKPSIPPYTLTNVYNYIPETKVFEEETNIEKYTSRELIELLSVRYNINEDHNEVLSESQTEFDSLLNSKLKHETNESEPAVQSTLSDLFAITPPSEQEKNIIQRLVLECFSSERADDYDSWIKVGWTLHNIEVSEDLFNLWIEFSKKSSKFRINEVPELRSKFFHRMRKEGDGPRLTERSLHNWAKKDNPKKYREIIDEFILEYIRQNVEPTHHHIAQLMKKMYKNNYVASINNRNTDWYYYDDSMNMWKQINQGIQLKKKISEEVSYYISQVRDKIRNDLAKATTDVLQNVLSDEMKKFLKIENNLYTNGFVEATMKMAETKFCDEDFTNKLNKDPYLFACRNGVLQLHIVDSETKKEKVEFRPGIPEDYLSFLAGQNLPDMEGIDYIPYNQNDPVYKDIYDFFDKIFPDTELRDYFLRLMASCLEGSNKEQQYYTWEGVGGNGKSKIVELMRLTFGDYQTSLQSTVLTRKRPESGAANPDIMAIKNRRFIYLQEPDDKEPLNTSRMKQFSGEDMIEARGLFKDQEKFKVTGKLNMMCNSKPIIKTMDRGTWRRIRVIPFVSKFVSADDPEYIEKKKNVFLRDNELDKKLFTWRVPFLSLLVHIYETQYLVNGLEPTPAIVKKASDEYKEANDSFAKFESDRIRSTHPSEKQKIDFNSIKRAYNSWVSDTNSSTRKLESNDLQKRINDEYGEPVNGKYYMDKIAFNTAFDVEAYDNNKSNDT
jgi:P4 family phage/plasmid primase-like protien